jgi:hypothetical protein
LTAPHSSACSSVTVSTPTAQGKVKSKKAKGKMEDEGQHFSHPQLTTKDSAALILDDEGRAVFPS